MTISPIATPRFQLVSMSLRFMQFLIARDLDQAAMEIGAQVSRDLAEHFDESLRFQIAVLEVDSTAQMWTGRAIVLTNGGRDRRVIGRVGFHSPPDSNGILEVGYGVEPPYRRRGIATEATRALIDWARRQGISDFRASIESGNLVSVRVVRRLGFVQVGVRWDETHGEELVFGLDASSAPC